MQTSETVGDLEASLVGSMLLRCDSLYELPAKFTPQMLLHPAARAAVTAMSKLARDGKAYDLPLVSSEARLNPEQAEWLARALELGTTNSLTAKAEYVLQRHERSGIRNALQTALDALQCDANTSDVLSALNAALLTAGLPGALETISPGEAVFDFADRLETEKSGKGQILRTGFRSFDDNAPIRNQNLIVLAARPGVGKSTLALNISENIARLGKHVLFHSLEMGTDELLSKCLSRLSGLRVDRFLDDSKLGEGDWAGITKAAEALSKYNLHINTQHHSIGDIYRITEKLHRKHTLALVVVDYLQLVSVNLGKNATDESRIGTASRVLKLMAMKLNVPVLAVAQLNREYEKRTGADNRPKLSDLRGSGRIEQDANTVAFLHASGKDPDGVPSQYVLMIAKARLGRVGGAVIRPDLAHSQFRDAPAPFEVLGGD